MPLPAAYSILSTHTGLPSLRLDPYMTYNFFIEIGGLLTGGFTEVSGLEGEIVTEEYHEGGVNGYTHYFPTRTQYPHLVFSRGLTDLDVLWNWYWAATQGKIIRLNGTILLLDNQRIPAMWWSFKGAYPVKWVGPQFDANNNNQVGIERLELVHQGLDKPLASQVLSAGRAAASLADQLS